MTKRLDAVDDAVAAAGDCDGGCWWVLVGGGSRYSGGGGANANHSRLTCDLTREEYMG